MWYYRLIKYSHIIAFSLLIIFTAQEAYAGVISALIIAAKVAWTIITTTAYLAVTYGVYATVAYSLYTSLASDDSGGSATYDGPHPTITVESGTPIAWAVGLVRVAGNIIRQNDMNDTGNNYIKAMVCHGEGEWEEILGHYVNDEPWDEMFGPASEYWEHLGTATQSGVTNLFDIENYNYRNKVITEYNMHRNNRVYYLRNINVVAKAYKCLEIGEASGGTDSWTRNPAQILWHFYIEKENRAVAELDTNAFTALSSYCAASLSYIDQYQSHIFPPVLSSDRVRATSTRSSSFFVPHFSIMKKSIKESEGRRCSWIGNATTDQRLNIDFGRSVVITAIELENGWTYVNPTWNTNIGIQNFVLQGSNTLSDFQSVTYTDVGKTWVNVAAGLAATEHAESTSTAFQIFTITNHTAYRYYSLKIADNFGDANYMMIRGVRFLGGQADSSVATEEYNNRYTFDYNFDTKIETHDVKKLIWRGFHGRCIQSQGKIKPVWEGAQEHDGAGGLQSKAVQHTFAVPTNVVSGSFTWNKVEKANIFIVNFIDSANEFKKDCVIMRDVDDIAVRGEVVEEETCWYLIDRASAKRRCRWNYNKSRYTDYQCSLTGFPDSQDLEIYDRVAVTDNEAGWAAKDFLIISKDEDQYGRPTFVLVEYFSGIYSDQGFQEQPHFGTNPLNPLGPVLDIDPASVSITVIAPGAGSQYVAGAVHVTYTTPPTATLNEIWLSTDDTNYYLAGTDVDGDIYIGGLGVLYDVGDTVYVKIVSISASGVKTETPTAYMDSVAIPASGALAKLASFYAGLYDLWGGNPAVGNAATKIVIGNLDGTPKIALGVGTADSMTIANSATYPGFFADGNGYLRAGNGTFGMVLDNGGLDINGDVDADHFVKDGTIVTPHVLDDNITRSWGYDSESDVTLGVDTLIGYSPIAYTSDISYTANDYFIHLWAQAKIGVFDTTSDYAILTVRFFESIEIVKSGTLKWTYSPALDDGSYYLTNIAGTASGLGASFALGSSPIIISGGSGGTFKEFFNGIWASLSGGEFGWGDKESPALGFDTVYAHLFDHSDPDAKADGYLRLCNNIKSYVAPILNGYSAGSSSVYGQIHASPVKNITLDANATTSLNRSIIIGAQVYTSGLATESEVCDSVELVVWERKK